MGKASLSKEVEEGYAARIRMDLWRLSSFSDFLFSSCAPLLWLLLPFVRLLHV